MKRRRATDCRWPDDATCGMSTSFDYYTTALNFTGKTQGGEDVILYEWKFVYTTDDHRNPTTELWICDRCHFHNIVPTIYELPDELAPVV